ncbi:hypothetical protein D3C80_1585230 [compost metagenome]
MTRFRQLPAALNDLAYNTMNNEIGITPDRRSEVRIELGSKPEMPETLRIIFRLLHRTEHHSRDNRRFLRALNLLQQRLQRLRMHRISFALHRITEVSGKADEVQQLLLIGVLMNPV